MAAAAFGTDSSSAPTKSLAHKMLGILCLAICCSAGCSGRPKSHVTVTGQFFGPDRSPLSGITYEAVQFVPADRDKRATGGGFGILKPDGTFEVDFGGEKMGMPQGDYLVLLVCAETDPKTQYWQFAGHTIWRSRRQTFPSGSPIRWASSWS